MLSFPFLFDRAPSEFKSATKYPPSSPSTALECIVNHVFLPIYDIQHDNYATEHVHALVCAVHAAACAYNQYIDDVHKPNWPCIINMLENLQVIFAPSTKSRKEDVVSQLGAMKTGGTL